MVILKKVAIEDYINKETIYSKQVRGNLEFYVETHHLDGGKHLQLFFYRNHPRIKEFIAINDKKHHLTYQKTHIKRDIGQMKLTINDGSYMVASNPGVDINITEYNYGTQLADFDKGKVAILIDIVFANETDNLKLISELKSLNCTEEK